MMMVIFGISLGIVLIYLVVVVVVSIRYKPRLFLIENSVILKKLRYKPGMTLYKKPKKFESVLIIKLRNNKIKETIFKNIKIDGTNDLTDLRYKFVVYQIKNLYYIRYCTDVTATMISFNDYQEFPPKKETIGISGNLIYGYLHHYSILPTTSMYRLKDINLICYGKVN